jgi:hypothetical protein
MEVMNPLGSGCLTYCNARCPINGCPNICKYWCDQYPGQNAAITATNISYGFGDDFSSITSYFP